MRKDYTQTTCLLSLGFVYVVYLFLMAGVMVNFSNKPISKKDIVHRSRSRARGRRGRCNREYDLEFLSLK